MLYSKRKKTLYKKFRVLRINIKNNNKIFKFKKNKWKTILTFLKKQNKITRIIKPYTNHDYSATVFASQGNSFKKKFKNNLIAKKTFNYFYGGFIKKYLKKRMGYVYNFKHLHKPKLACLEFFESRLDSVLYRSKFCFSVRNARQLISHKHITVNDHIEKNKSYILKTGDRVSITLNSFYLINENLKKVIKKKGILPLPVWPIPPKYLLINYKTLEIIFGNIKNFNFSIYFPFKLNLDSIILSYYRD